LFRNTKTKVKSSVSNEDNYCIYQETTYNVMQTFKKF